VAHSVAFVNSIGATFTTITDAFARTAASSWGSTDTGQAWTCEGGSAADFSVSSGTGRVSVATTNVTRRCILAGISVLDSDATMTITIPEVATGATESVGWMPRYTDSSNYIRVDARFNTDSNVTIRLVEQVAGVANTLGTSSNITAYTNGSSWKLRYRLVGQVLTAKLWDAGGSEPDDWDITGLVTDPAVSVAAAIGTRTIFESGNSNGTETVQFDNVSISSPTQTRLDLNDGTTWTLLDSGTTFPPPSLKRAVVQTLMTDGARIPAAAYDNRILNLRLRVTTGSEDASATALQNLFRELDRPFNILKWHPTSATNPVFFRTFRTSADEVREVLPSGAVREVDVSLLAEPFAYGLKRTLTTSTVTNDPASSCYVDIDSTNIVGDVETPLILSFDYSGVDDDGPTAISVRRRGTPSLAPFVLQAEAMTGGTDTSIQANDAVMSGSGQNYMRCTFATVAGTMTTRLTSSTFPTLPSTDNRGTYRVFLRYRKGTAGNDINVQLGWSFGSTSATNREVALAANTTNRRWADLGTVQIPFGADPVYDGLSGVELPARGGVFTVAAQRTSGSGNVDFDALVFMPACDRFALVSWPTSSGPTLAVVDGVAEAVYNLGVDGAVYPREMSALAGMFPYLTPNQDNRICILLNAGGNAATASDDITATFEVTPSYYPRYLYVRPAST
jgi:hypothetical protein